MQHSRVAAAYPGRPVLAATLGGAWCIFTRFGNKKSRTGASAGDLAFLAELLQGKGDGAGVPGALSFDRPASPERQARHEDNIPNRN